MSLEYLKSNLKILAIDDSKLNRAIIKKTLKNLDLEVDEASDGEEGLEKLKHKEYDLILVDIIMPKLDGFGFLSAFKSIIGKKFIPVILMTGSDDLNSKIKGLRIGADDFLLKPLNEKELIARVLSLLRLKMTHNELFEKNQLIQKEMETAQRVQQYIIPKDFSHIPYPLISGRYLPIESIGGDYFDCYDLGDDHYGFLIADVTGHGIPAALVMTMSKMTFSLFAPQHKTTNTLLSAVNKEMKSLLLDYQYITSFYVIYDHKNKLIKFTNAGHTRALFYRAETEKMLALDTQGFFIGIAEDTVYEQKSIKVKKGDRLFLYTDGLTEIKNNNKEEYGDKNLASFIKNYPELNSDNFCDSLLQDIKNFTSLDNRDDDIAFLNIEF